MESTIAQAIQLKYQPVGLLWSDEKPADAMQFSEGKWGCVMWLAVHAAKGKAAAADKSTFGCIGGGVGLGFGEQYKNFPGGEEGFCHFLSTGNARRQGGNEIAEKIKPFMTKESFDNFLHGERYIQTPELVEKFITNLPMMAIPVKYVVFRPLSDIDLSGEKPQTVIFFVNPDQLSALTVLANYGRDHNENVIIPYARLPDDWHLSLSRSKIRKAARGRRLDRSFRPCLCAQAVERSSSDDLCRSFLAL